VKKKKKNFFGEFNFILFYILDKNLFKNKKKKKKLVGSIQFHIISYCGEKII